jgi:peptide/nickel transport system ATP-binding protein
MSPMLPAGVHASRSAPAPLLEVRDLVVDYGRPGLLPWPARPALAAVRGVSFAIAPGETFALVGESGSGKSTIARAVQGLVHTTAGRISFEGQDITQPVRRRAKPLRRAIQIIFQNPDASLNRRHRVATIIGRPLSIFFGLRGAERQRRIAQLLEDVRLDAGYASRFPGQLSGGERQRVAIARALAAEPRLLLCDEILSALDVSVQANVIDLLRTLQQEKGLAYLFISHDLAVVRWLADRVGVLYRGELCDVGPAERIYRPPLHPYTESLLQAIPTIGRRADPYAATNPR